VRALQLTAPTALCQAAMAGAAPLSLADDLTSGEEALSWLSLPHAILLHTLRMTPQDARARAACVCRTWRDAAADPALFAVLRFDDGCAARLNVASLLRLCARAGAALRELRLEAPLCDAVTAAAVIAALRAGGCAGVQRLVLRNGDSLSAEQVQQLAAACPALEHAACGVRCESADDVTTACACLPGPLTLYVHYQLDAARAALQLPAQVAEVDIWNCTLDAACVAALREALRANTTLKTLSCWQTGIDDVGAAALGEALRMNAALTSLFLFNNNIGDAGAASLGQALRTNATLTSLDLRFNHVGAPGAAALGEALRTNTSLKTLALTLGYNLDIGDAGEAALREALRTNTTLATLLLNGRNMVGDGRG